jgi:methionyl-tRNA synthetase
MTISSSDSSVITRMQVIPQLMEEAIEQFKLKEALHWWMELARRGNKYLTETEPWHLIKTNPQQVQTILYISVQLMAQLALLGEPFLPFTSRKLADMLNLDNLLWETAKKGEIIPPGTPLKEPQLLFERIEDDMLPKQ